jgi:ADP-ribose pyrophosphatase
MTKMKDAKILSTELLIDSFKKVVNEKVQFTEDDVQDWIYMDTPKSIVVIALNPDNEAILVKLYRHNLREDFLELPAGGAEHTGETTLEAAKRELLEETGYSSDDIKELGSYYVLPSETNRWTHFFLALNARKESEPNQDNLIEKYFDMSVHLVPFEKLSDNSGANKLGIMGVESLYGLTLAKEYLSQRN